MIQAMVLSSFLVACVAFMAAAVRLRKIQGDEDLDGVRAMTPSPLPTLPAAAALPAESPLSPAQLEKLTQTLTQQYGREPRIAVKIDPSVIGGLRVQVGDDVIDGTIASRLTELRLQLAG